MGSSIKINAISIDLAGAANEIDMVKCDHFSIRGFVAETRERDPQKCWPFSEESVSLGDQQSHSLPSLSVPKFRWWRCMSCIRDIDADGTNDCGLPSNSRSIISGKKLDGSSSVIPSQSKPNSLTVVDQEKEKNINIAGSAIVEKEDVNCESSRKNDQRATTSLKKVHPPSMNASTVRSKGRKLASPEQVGNKRPKVNKSATDISSVKETQNVDQLAVTTVASSVIARVVEDRPPNESSESRKLATSGLQRRKTRRMSELVYNDNQKKPERKTTTSKKESCSKKEPVKGTKRKVSPEKNYASRKAGATSDNASKSRGSDQGDSESTDSGFDRDPINGKQKNRRFQIVDEFVVPSCPSQEGVRENDADPGKSALSTPVHSLVKEKDSVPSPLSAQRTDQKLSLARKKKNKSEIDSVKSSLISFSSGVDEGSQVKPRTGPSINASSQPTREFLNEKRVGSLLDDRLASQGYVRKPIPQVNDRPVLSLHMPDNEHMRSTDAEANCVREFGSSSNSNTGGWLSALVDAVDFSSNSNSNLRITSSSTQVADPSSVPQKDASGADRKGKRVMVQNHQGALGSQSHDRKENRPEEQNGDILKAIAELLAKKLDEKCLTNKEEDVGNKQPPQEPAHKSKNALLIDLNETYDNETSLEENNTSRPPQPPSNTSAARKEDHFQIGRQQKPRGFLPISQPYMPSPFAIFPPPQENRASSIRFSGQNCQWLGNVPTMANQHPSPSSYRVLRACDTCHSVPPQYREAPSRPIWTSSMIPPQCHPSPVPLNHMDQPTRLSMLSQAPRNENTWNLNFVGANVNHTSFGCNKLGAGVNCFRSVVGESSRTAYPTQQRPFDLYSNGFAPESSRQSFPVPPPFGTSLLSFQSAQAPWSHHHHEKKTMRDGTIAPVYSSHETPLCLTSNRQERLQLLGGSNSMKPPLKSRMRDQEMKQKRKAESCSNASASPPQNSSGSIECIVNRNPADFTIPEPGNVYMLTGENLKVRKRAPYKKKPRLCKQDALKESKKPVGPVTDNA